MHIIELSYLKHLSILADDDYRGHHWFDDGDRTGTGVRRMASPVQIDCSTEITQNNEIPLFTIRPIWWGGLIAEFCWMMRGNTSLESLDDLHQGASKLWRPWALDSRIPDTQYGSVYTVRHIGKGYGYQFNGPLKKLETAILAIQAQPFTRHACFSLWEQTDLKHMALRPCHGCWLTFRALRDPNAPEHTRILTLAHTQRSQDIAVGAPYNVVFYQLLLRVIVAWLNAQARHREKVKWVEGWVTHKVDDLHLYVNHLDQAREMLARRESLDGCLLSVLPPTATCAFNPPPEWGDASLADAMRKLHPSMFVLANYEPLAPAIKLPVAV